MPKPLVFWRTDEADDYVHTEKDCAEIVNAKTVQCGAIEDAQRSGHTRACPYCQRARNLPEKKETAVVKSKAGAPTVQRASAWVATLAAIACTWLCCWLYYNEQSTDIKNAAYNDGYVAAETDYSETYESRYREGYDTGKSAGYDYGKREGYTSGYAEGYTKGKDSVDTDSSYQDGYNNGYNKGYDAGYNDGAGSYSQYSAPQSSYTYTVYITATGHKYHAAGCQYLKNSSIPIDINQAIAQGYTACSRCNP